MAEEKSITYQLCEGHCKNWYIRIKTGERYVAPGDKIIVQNASYAWKLESHEDYIVMRRNHYWICTTKLLGPGGRHPYWQNSVVDQFIRLSQPIPTDPNIPVEYGVFSFLYVDENKVRINGFEPHAGFVRVENDILRSDSNQENATIFDIEFVSKGNDSVEIS